MCKARTSYNVYYCHFCGGHLIFDEEIEEPNKDKKNGDKNS